MASVEIRFANAAIRSKATAFLSLAIIISSTVKLLSIHSITKKMNDTYH